MLLEFLSPEQVFSGTEGSLDVPGDADLGEFEQGTFQAHAVVTV